MDQAHQLEIDCRQMVVDRLARVLTKLNKDADAEHTAAVDRQAELRASYPTADDAHEAWGWGYITEAEYNAIANQLSEADMPTVTSAARDTLRDILAHLRREIRDLKWEALPEAEKERIRKVQSDYREGITQLKKERCYA